MAGYGGQMKPASFGAAQEIRNPAGISTQAIILLLPNISRHFLYISHTMCSTLRGEKKPQQKSSYE